MNLTLRQPLMTREQFFLWADAQDTRYEFDGFRPVAMTEGNINHTLIAFNIHTALRGRLRRSVCKPLGLDSGVATIGDSVRYPDAVVTCSPLKGDSRLVPNPVVVFEVISPTSGHMDRIIKLREYGAVECIRRYVIVESATIGLTVHERPAAVQTWTTTTLMAEDVLTLPDIGIEIPVAEIYEGVDLPVTETAGPSVKTSEA